MASGKRLLFVGVPVVAAGGTGIWALINGFAKETVGEANVALSLEKINTPRGASNTSRPKAPTITPSTVETPTNPTTIKNEEDTNRAVVDLRNLDQEPQQNINEPDDSHEESLKIPDDEEHEDLPTAEYSVQEKDNSEEELREQMKGVGLSCGDATEEADCNVEGDSEINVIWEGKKGTYVQHGENNGTFKLRISSGLISGKEYSFAVTKNPIKLKNKDNQDEIITLEKYEHYGLEKDSDTDLVYLTKKLTSEQGMIKDLGLPGRCAGKITSDPFDYAKAKNNPTCRPLASEIKRINFEGKREGGATSKGNMNLYIQKVNDTVTYSDGYRFFIQGFKDIDISDNSKLALDVWWDFRVKETEEGNPVLERVWKNESELLSRVGLSCGEDGACTINDGSLKVKVGEGSIENGKKSGDGNIYLERRNTPGHYEGLRFSVWGGKMEIEGSGSTLEMKEAEIYHITKEDGSTPSYYLTKKHDVKDMISVHLGLPSRCPPLVGQIISCNGVVSHLKKFKFHDGEGEQRVGQEVDNNLPVSIEISPDGKYPFGYKFTLQSSKKIDMGKISLEEGKATNFKIKKDVERKRLYLEEDKK